MLRVAISAVERATGAEGPSGDLAERGLHLSTTKKTKNTQPLRFPKLVGAAVIAVMLDCTPKHVYDLAKHGRIPHYRFGASIRFDPDKVKEWLDEHEIAA
jgi:excisionase family DNA binding protein